MTKQSKGTLYFSLIMVLTFMVSLLIGTGCMQQKDEYTQTHHIKLNHDGSSYHTTEFSYINTGNKILETISFVNSNPAIDDILDENGEKIPFVVHKKPDYFKYIVLFHEPIAPGETVKIKTISRYKDFVKQNKKAWIYKRYHIPMPETIYTETVSLPKGAKLLSVIPNPTRKSEENGILTLTFNAHLQENEAFSCTIEYRL